MCSTNLSRLVISNAKPSGNHRIIFWSSYDKMCHKLFKNGAISFLLWLLLGILFRQPARTINSKPQLRTWLLYTYTGRQYRLNEKVELPMSRPIRVLSERLMSKGFEPTVSRMMEKVRCSLIFLLFNVHVSQLCNSRFKKQWWVNRGCSRLKRWTMWMTIIAI